MKQTVILIIIIQMLNSCNINSEVSDYSELRISDNCKFWMETFPENKKVHFGISGSCTPMSVKKYSILLDSMFNKITDKNVFIKNTEKIYLNIYDCSSVMRYDLIQKINSYEKWDSLKNSPLDERFLIFNNETNYINSIENIIKKQLGNNYTLSFQGIMCKNNDSIETDNIVKEDIIIKECYPLSFGVAVFTFNKKE